MRHDQPGGRHWRGARRCCVRSARPLLSRFRLTWREHYATDEDVAKRLCRFQAFAKDLITLADSNSYDGRILRYRTLRALHFPAAPYRLRLFRQQGLFGRAHYQRSG